MVNLFKLVTLKDRALLGCVSIRLPLPGCLLDMFPEDVSSPTEDSSLHGGRVRSFKHERGSWATYVYLPCKTDTLPLMNQSIDQLPNVLPNLDYSPRVCTLDHPEEEFGELLEELLSLAGAGGAVWTPQEELHLSLSQTVVLRHHWIQPFNRSLRAGLVHCKRFAQINLYTRGKADILTVFQLPPPHTDIHTHTQTHLA